MSLLLAIRQQAPPQTKVVRVVSTWQTFNKSKQQQQIKWKANTER